jgi:hypothetical protein
MLPPIFLGIFKMKNQCTKTISTPITFQSHATSRLRLPRTIIFIASLLGRGGFGSALVMRPSLSRCWSAGLARSFFVLGPFCSWLCHFRLYPRPSGRGFFYVRNSVLFFFCWAEASCFRSHRAIANVAGNFGGSRR